MTESIDVLADGKSVSEIPGIKNPILISMLDTLIGFKLVKFEQVVQTASATNYSGDLALRWRRNRDDTFTSSLYFDDGVLTFSCVNKVADETDHILHVEAFPVNEDTPDDGEMQYTASLQHMPEASVVKPRKIKDDKAHFERLTKMFYSFASGYRPDQD